jgi:hypothetical protein
MAKISQELRETVAAHPHISEVHFTKSGAHYFNVHEYKGEKGKGKKYGRMSLKAIHVGNEGDRKLYKNKAVPVESEEIVETLGRDIILKEPAAPKDE